MCDSSHTRIVEFASLTDGQTTRSKNENLLWQRVLGDNFGSRKAHITRLANGLTERDSAGESSAETGIALALLVLANQLEEVVKQITRVLHT